MSENQSNNGSEAESNDSPKLQSELGKQKQARKQDRGEAEKEKDSNFELEDEHTKLEMPDDYPRKNSKTPLQGQGTSNLNTLSNSINFGAEDQKIEQKSPQQRKNSKFYHDNSPQINGTTSIKKSEFQTNEIDGFPSSKYQLDTLNNEMEFEHETEDKQSNFENFDKYKSEKTNTIQKSNKPFKCFDFIFPAGILAKLVKLEKMIDMTDTHLETILFDKFGFNDPAPVLICVGGRNTGRGNFTIGMARAAFRSDAVIVDSGVSTGMEGYCIREKVTLVGVFPGEAAQNPKIKPKNIEVNELANGHTHMFKITDP